MSPRPSLVPAHVYGQFDIAHDMIRDADNDRCLGGKDAEAEVDFPTTFTRAILEQGQTRPKQFAHVHCSGILAERDQMKPLWFLQEGRRAKVCQSHSMR